MTRPFILSASVGGAGFAVPARLAAMLDAAEAVGLDLLLLGSVADRPFDTQVLAVWAAPRSTMVGIVATVPADNACPLRVARGPRRAICPHPARP